MEIFYYKRNILCNPRRSELKLNEFKVQIPSSSSEMHQTQAQSQYNEINGLQIII